ncbi:MAG: hypothetical protein ACRD9S_22820 [Pyrinomonadaceae bacterium]
MGFFDNWKKNRLEKARQREEQRAALAAKREKEARSTAILLAINTRIANSALRETERERSRNLSAHYQDQVIRQIAGKAQALLLATTDMIGGGRLTSQFLIVPHGGTGEPGDFAIFTVYVSSVIKNCAELLEASRSRRDNSLEGKDGAISVSHEEIQTGMDTTLATSLTRAEWIMSERKRDLPDHLDRLLISAINHNGLRLAGPIATKALAGLKSRSSI